MEESPQLAALRSRLEEEEEVYSACLTALDALAGFPLPSETLRDLPEQVARLNELWSRAARPEGPGLGGAFRRRAFDAVAPALDRQADFNSTLVQALNGHLSETALLHGRLREVVAALIRYLQRLLPVIDARDRMASALATTRAELVLEAFDRRLEAVVRRVDGLRALQDRVETLSEELRGLRSGLAGAAPAVAAAAERGAAGATYAAFENRFRGDAQEIRSRLADYLPLFRGLAPVADLGCGRGEFLELLREEGIAGIGVDGNAHFVRACVERGLEVVEADLLAFLRGRAAGSLGGVFAAQVAEHLRPAALLELLAEAHRSLRKEGLLLIETVNTRSLTAFLETFNRDLTHEKPLHPETLSFLAAASGFTDVRVELRSPLPADARLRSLPPEGLPARAVEILNENTSRLNQLLYGPQEYALLARR